MTDIVVHLLVFHSAPCRSLRIGGHRTVLHVAHRSSSHVSFLLLACAYIALSYAFNVRTNECPVTNEVIASLLSYPPSYIAMTKPYIVNSKVPCRHPGASPATMYMHNETGY